MIEAMKEMPKKGGRPKAVTQKVHIGFRLAAETVEGIKATGPGYNARVEQALREALELGVSTEKTRRSPASARSAAALVAMRCKPRQPAKPAARKRRA